MGVTRRESCLIPQKPEADWRDITSPKSLWKGERGVKEWARWPAVINCGSSASCFVLVVDPKWRVGLQGFNVALFGNTN